MNDVVSVERIKNLNGCFCWHHTQLINIYLIAYAVDITLRYK